MNVLLTKGTNIKASSLLFSDQKKILTLVPFIMLHLTLTTAGERPVLSRMKIIYFLSRFKSFYLAGILRPPSFSFSSIVRCAKKLANTTHRIR